MKQLRWPLDHQTSKNTAAGELAITSSVEGVAGSSHPFIMVLKPEVQSSGPDGMRGASQGCGSGHGPVFRRHRMDDTLSRVGSISGYCDGLFLLPLLPGQPWNLISAK